MTHGSADRSSGFLGTPWPAVRFAYEWHDDSGNWFRSYGNELWEFDERGLMRRRVASVNDAPIRESDRKGAAAG